MAASVGRNLQIKQNTTILASVRSKSISYAGESIDITSDDDAGFRTLLSDNGQEAIDISFDGVATDKIIRGLALTSGTKLLTDINILWPDTSTLTGDFYLSSYEESGSYKDAVTFTASLQSSGAWTYTPVA